MTSSCYTLATTRFLLPYPVPYPVNVTWFCITYGLDRVVASLIANFSLRFHLAQKLAQRDPYLGAT